MSTRKQKKKERKKKKRSSPGHTCPLDQRKEGKKNTQETLVSWAWCPPRRPLAIRQLLVPVVVIPSPFVVVSSLSFSPRRSSSSRSRCSPLAVHRHLIPVVLVFSSLSFSPRHSSSPHSRRCRPPMEHPASSGGGGCWVTFVVNSSSRYLKSFRNKKHENRINKNSPTAQETLFDVSCAFFHCFASSDGVSPSSPRCCVVIQFGLMAALPSSRCLGVAPVTTPRAAARSGGGGCWVTFVVSSSSRYLKKFSNKKT